MSENKIFTIERYIVRDDRIICELSIPDERYRVMTPRMAAFVEGQYPDLPHHVCKNDKGTQFGDVIEQTSLPHLIEHLVISILIRESASGSASFVGTTEWLDEERGLARIEVEYDDDLATFSAFKKAVEFATVAVETCYYE